MVLSIEEVLEKAEKIRKIKYDWFIISFIIVGTFLTPYSLYLYCFLKLLITMSVFPCCWLVYGINYVKDKLQRSFLDSFFEQSGMNFDLASSAVSTR